MKVVELEYNPEVAAGGLEGSGQGRRPKRINCFKCSYFKITWDAAHPRSCLVFGFKGKELPSVTVRKTTGKDCPVFTPRDGADAAAADPLSD